MCCCVTIIHSSTQKARKVYMDDGWEDISEWVRGGMWTPKGMKVTFIEKRQLVLFRNSSRPYKIEIGEEYLSQFNKIDGDTFTWRTKTFLYELMCKYDLFQEC